MGEDGRDSQELQSTWHVVGPIDVVDGAVWWLVGKGKGQREILATGIIVSHRMRRVLVLFCAVTVAAVDSGVSV